MQLFNEHYTPQIEKSQGLIENLSDLQSNFSMHSNAEVEAFKYGFRLATALFIESTA